MAIWMDTASSRRTRTEDRGGGGHDGDEREGGGREGHAGGRRGVAVDTKERWPRRWPWRRKRPHRTHSLRRKAQARVSLCQVGEGQRGDSSLGRLALAGGVGGTITCESPLIDRVGDDRCARNSRSSRALTVQMMSTTPCLRAGTPAVMRVRRRRRRLRRRRGHRAERDRGGRRAGRRTSLALGRLKLGLEIA